MQYAITLDQVIETTCSIMLDPMTDPNTKNLVMEKVYEYMERVYGMKLWLVN
jgi:hypothetical protein